MPTMLQVMQSRIGIAEVAGKGTNPVIDKWADQVGWPNLTDNDAWCSICACSAADDAGLPMPALNVRPAARGWLTWGVAVPLDDVKPGDVAVWPRNNSKWQGHVNVVEVIEDDWVVCIGGNQAGPKGDAVTRARKRLKSEALGFRRAVPATVKDLRAAGSTTIKSADTEEKIGIAATFFAPLFEGGREIINGMPSVSTTEGLTYLQTAAKMATGAIAYVGTNPWVLSFTIAGLLIWLNSVRKKRSRVAEHANGIPLASEVAKLGTA